MTVPRFVRSQPITRLDPAASPRDAKPDWDHCRTVVRLHGRTFYFGSHLLPLARRQAIHAAYAYCRVADDIVDRAPADGLAEATRALDAWQAELDAPIDPVAVAFADARRRYGIPIEPIRDLLTGLRMDLAPRPFETWDDLRLYCYRVAGTIGLIAAPIFGCRDIAALPRAVDLGIAMQLTNILRDVAEDARMGRVYLPLEDLDRFGCQAEDLLAGHSGGDLRGLMRFEIARARDLYATSRPGIAALSPAGRLTTVTISHLYAKILAKIEEQDHDVYAPRAYVPTPHKLGAMPHVAADFLRLSLPAPVRPWF
ncbi:MAG: phytoene/squalene synthase family protein [Chloroflexota bacterium]|nr:phytoene/squalene synthase family protein [Chloroflexota bacterium]